MAIVRNQRNVRPPLWPDVPLTPREKLTARGGNDIALAYKLAGASPTHKGPIPIYPDDPESDAYYGTHFVSKPIERFTFLDALEEALGTDTFLMRMQEYNLRRMGPLELYSNLGDQVKHVVKVLLGKDPVDGKDWDRATPEPWITMQAEVIKIQRAGESAEVALSGDAAMRSAQARGGRS